MIRVLVIACVIPAATFSAPAPTRPDLLRFNNGDQLHGTFDGVRDGATVLWKRQDLAETAEFKTSQLRQIVLRGASAAKPLGSTSHAGLVNGDRIPGRITAIDPDTITLESPAIGTTHVPRKQVSLLAPNPLGGRIRYFGPFSEDEWKMVHPSFPDGLPEPPAAADGKPEKDEDDAKSGEAGDDAGQPGRWVFSGAAWYWQDKRPGTALIRESGMPERTIMAFDLAWRNQLSLIVGFHADFKRPPAAKGEDGDEEPPAKAQIHRFVPGDISSLPAVFGNSSVVQIYSNYIMLIRTRVDKDGKLSCERSQISHEGLRLGERNRARIEIRSNRASGDASFFVDGEFIAQWDAYSDECAGDFKNHSGSTGFGFVSQGPDSSIKISDVTISEWNGMPDSARSMQTEDKDVILLTNGTDRFAGRVTGMDKQAAVLFESGLGKFAFPVDDIAEIRFAGKERAPAPDESANLWTIRFGPMGSVSGRPLAGDHRTIGIESPILGPLKVSMEAALLIDLNSSKLKIDDWETDF
jgi:hypothetical protein